MIQIITTIAECLWVIGVMICLYVHHKTFLRYREEIYDLILRDRMHALRISKLSLENASTDQIMEHTIKDFSQLSERITKLEKAKTVKAKKGKR